MRKFFAKLVKVLFLFMFSIIVFLSVSHAAIPVGHPRILLSTEKLNQLQSRAAANDATWVRFKGWIDPYVGSGTTPDYGMAAWHFALAYKITENSAYATRAIQLADIKVAAGQAANRTDDHLYVDDGVSNIAKVYDWCYDLLTTQQKTNYQSWMKTGVYEVWYTTATGWDGWGINTPSNNYHYSFLTATLYAALAIDGDSSESGWMWNVFYDKMEKNTGVLNYLNTGGKGGGSYEGNNYIRRICKIHNIFNTLKSGGGRDYFDDTDFTKENGYYLLYSFQPNNQNTYPGGDLATYSSNPIEDRDRLNLLEISKGTFSDNIKGYIFDWLDKNYSIMSNINQSAYDFILGDSEATRINYKNLPLSYFARGSGWINSRSSWETDAVSVSFVSADRIASHQHEDQNSFVIFKGGWQVGDAVTYSSNGLSQEAGAHSTFLINQQGQIGQWKEGAGSIKAYESTTNYTYTIGSASSAYKSDSTNMLEAYDRSLVHIRPDYVIVFDQIVTVNPEHSKKCLFQFKNQPIINGNLITATNDQGKVFVKTLLPLNPTITAVNLNTIDSTLNSWRADVEPSVKAKKDLFLHMLYPCASTVSNPPAVSRIQSSAGNMVGAFIPAFGSNPNWVVLFSTGGPNINTIGFTADGTGPVKSLICGLTPGDTYEIKREGTTLFSKQASSQGTIYFESSLDGSLAFTVSKTPVYNVGGRIRNASGQGIAGVNINTVGSITAHATTDSNGYFTLTGCPLNYSFTVMPVQNGYSFTPQSLNVTSLSNNIANFNFTGLYAGLPTGNQPDVSTGWPQQIALGTGDVKVVGPAERRGVINPDKGDSADIFFKGNGTGQYECKIFTVTGDLVWHDTKKDVSTGVFQWHPGDVASGGYVVFLNGPGVEAKKKLVVLR